MKRSPIRKKRPGPPRRGPHEIPAKEWRNPGYRAWCTKQQCAIPGCYSNQISWDGGWAEPAHTEFGGMSQKGPDRSCVPLCRTCHDKYDGKSPLINTLYGHSEFEKFYGVDMKFLAAAHWARYLKSRGGKP